MSKKTEIRSKVAEMLASGATKSETYARLRDQGVDDVLLAYFIVAYPDPERCARHRTIVLVLVVLMLAVSAIAFFTGFNLGAKFGPRAAYFVAILCSLIPLLFAWGFYSNNVAAYNTYLLFSILQLPFSGVLQEFFENPAGAAKESVLPILFLVFVWYVRERVFPGFSFMGAKKDKRQYVFKD